MLRLKSRLYEEVVLNTPDGEITLHIDGQFICIEAPRSIEITRRPGGWVRSQPAVEEDSRA